MRLLFFLLSLILLSDNGYCWGEKGHQLIVASALKKLDLKYLSNCSIDQLFLIQHVNDPDTIWKQKRRDFKNESFAHYFHLESQPKDWKNYTEPNNVKNGFLPYRILNFYSDAINARKQKNYEVLKIKLIGLSHYLGDLSQPLHTTLDHDGEFVSLKGIHSQYETKMISRYIDEIRLLLEKNSHKDSYPVYWDTLSYKDLILQTLEQSNAKSKLLLKNAALSFQNHLITSRTKASKRKKKEASKPFFSKKLLWEKTNSMTIEQLRLSAELIRFTIKSICQ